MSTEIKNQNTLFRFVSLRNPELVKKKKIKKGFVLHPSLQTSIFQVNMLRRTTETKWQNLQNTASAFNFIKDENQLEIISKTIFQQAVWLAEYKNSNDINEFEKIVATTPLDLKVEINLWDNLFYQVVTEQNFYLKEQIIQVLTFNNLLKTYKEVNTLKSFNLELFNELKNAQIVLPSELFEEILTENSDDLIRESEVEEPEISSAEILNQAKQNVKALNLLKEEVTILEKSYQKSYKRNYDSALNEYNQKIEPQLREYQAEIDAEKQRICKETNGEANFENYCTSPNVKYPEIPPFTFEFPAPVDEKTLTSKLSKESFSTLKNINATKDNETFEDIFDKIELAFKKENEIIIENTTFSNQAIMMGGVLLSENTLKRGSLPSADIRPAFVPNRFGIRNIGIADYKKVVSHVCCYDAGEVSHIENIMAKEIKEKESERIRKSEVSTTTEQTNESERFTDVSTTERFEMQTEVAKILQENESFEASASVGYSGFGFSANIGANYATSTSKEESNIQAVNYAKDITQKATEKIVSRLRTEKTVKITDEFKERYKHGYDNTQGEKHVSGVFRFVNAIYKNQIYNYGKRLMYEFMIPQPSKLHRLGMEQNRSNPNAVFLSKPIDPRIDFPNASFINEYNYKILASKYGAEVNTHPENIKYVGKSFEHYTPDQNKGGAKNGSIVIPKGYFSEIANANITGMSAGGVWDRKILVSIGDHSYISSPERIDVNLIFL